MRIIFTRVFTPSAKQAPLRVLLTAILLGSILVFSACEVESGKPTSQPAGDTKTLTRAAGETDFYIDTVNKQVPSAKVPVTVKVDETPQIMVNGWAVDTPGKSTAGGVVMVIDGTVEVPTTYGAERADVAKFLNNPSYTNSAFVGWINVATITKGQHILSFKVVTADKQHYYEPANKITLAIQ
ncbi:MAG TPA: hypothetical protein VI306_11570 [Pyrinomonadaceae bacterium]